jgi:hypothetical protein
MGVKGRQGLRLTTSPPSVLKMWMPQHLTNLWASVACYKESYQRTSVNQQRTRFASLIDPDTYGRTGENSQVHVMGREPSATTGAKPSHTSLSPSASLWFSDAANGNCHNGF